MIPKIIHQTWKTAHVPDRFAAWAESWKRLNPGYEYRLWTDRMLLDFVAEHYPDFIAVYASYPQQIMRADAARYLLLHHFGGIYADLDTECVAPFDALLDEDRVVLCHEPPLHGDMHRISRRGLSRLLFNGLIASPARHPFWDDVIDTMVQCRFAPGVLDATGPFLLTGVYESSERDGEVIVYPAQLFCPLDNRLEPVPPYAPNPLGTLARHYWAGTWSPPRRKRSLQEGINRLRTLFFKLRYRLTRGAILDPSTAQSLVAPEIRNRPPPSGDRVAILVPIRDGAQNISGFRELIKALDYPKSAIKVVFCEGDSTDDTRRLLEEAAIAMRPNYRSVSVTTFSSSVTVPQQERWKVDHQRRRRAALARVRNHLIDVGLDETDDWALWIDSDLWHFPPDIIQTLRASGGRVVVPHCATYPGGPTYDLNTFASAGFEAPYVKYRNMRDGLFQPPRREGKVCLDSLRYSRRVEVDGVGGTMLLVDAALHRGGLRFPELPYRGFIETEGLGMLARDIGVTPVGLPRVEVLHVPW
jgi:hypothetical protein